jgi:hypothetical protein
MQSWQARDLEALDAAWLRLAGGAGSCGSADPAAFGDPAARGPQRAYIERPRGHSKTTDMALQVAWILLAARQPVSGLAAAADRDQANLIHRAIERLARENDELCRELQFLQHLVRNVRTGSLLEIISSDVRSSWGALPDFVVCDELCHWERPELWYSLLSSAAKKPACVLVVLTNAGIGRGWQWDVREHARGDAAWYFSSLAGPQAPWITQDWLAEQRALLPPPVFARLWLNVWQHSDGEFVSLSEAEACRDDRLARRDRGTPGTRYVAAVDYAEKHDLTVGCLCHQEGARIVVDRMDVVRPGPAHPTPVQWVEQWIEHTAARFGLVTFVVDEHQLVGTVQRLEHRHHIQRFDFAGGLGNHRLAIRLRQLIIGRQVAWYAGCGAVPTPAGSGRDDLETELASLLLRQSETGRVRLDHRRDGVHHDDRSFALGLASLVLSEQSPVPEFLDISLPRHPGLFG